MTENRPHPAGRGFILTVIMLVSPFYLNDFANLYVKDWRWWLFIDYAGVKLVPLLAAAWLIRNGEISAASLGLRKQSIPAFLLVFLITALLGTLADQNGYKLIEALPGYKPLGGMPKITSPVWDWIDLTFGLLMVGVCEELVFRGFMREFIARRVKNAPAVIIISSFAFGLIHWSLGLHVVLITSVIGAIFMIAYLKTRSLPAVMLAHFAVNFIDFAGVIPKSVFKFIS